MSRAPHGQWTAAPPRRSSERRPGARVTSSPGVRHPVHDPPLRPRPPGPHTRRRGWGGGGGAEPLSASRRGGLRGGEASLDRAHAAAYARVRERLPARDARARRRPALPGRAPPAGAAARARPGAAARGAPRGPSGREAAARRRPPRRARSVVSPPGAHRGGRPPRRRRRAGRHELHLASDPRATHPLGELLHQRRDELQLASAPGAARDRRLRGRARGGPPRDP